MEDIYKLIDDINLQKLENLDSRVNEAITTDNDDALFILGSEERRVGKECRL